MFIFIAHAQTETAAETVPADQGLFASLGINASLFVFQLINFVIVALVLWYLILKPLTKKMAERQQLIDKSIDNAKKVEETLHRSEQKYQEKIDQAKVEGNKILENTNAEAVKMAEDMKSKAKKEIELLVVQAKKNIRIEKDEATRQVKEEAVELMMLAMEKILSEKMTAKDDKKIIEQTLRELEK